MNGYVPLKTENTTRGTKEVEVVTITNSFSMTPTPPVSGLPYEHNILISCYNLIYSSVDLKGECSDAASQWYCNTLFYKAFPKALNIGRSGWTIEEWTAAINNGDPLIAKLAKLGLHSHIIIVLGGSLAVNMLQSNPTGDMAGLSEATKKLGSLL